MTKSISEILARLTANAAERKGTAPQVPPKKDPALVREIEALRAELTEKGVPFTEGALEGMAENRLLHRKAEEQNAALFAQTAAIPRRFAKATLSGFMPFDDVQAAAFERVCAWSHGVMAGETPWMILAGSWGTGKSHMACAALNSLRECKGLTVRFVACLDLVRAVQDTYSNESGTTEAKIIADLSRIDILCLDDVAADPTLFESKLLTRVLDARYRNDRPTMIVTNLSIREKCGKPSEFDAFVGNLVASRVHECATFVDCTTTDFRRGLKQRKVDQNN